MEYKGIQLHKGVKLKNKLVKKAIDEFIDLVKSNKHILKSEYKNTGTKILINFNCEHEPHWITPHMYKGRNSGCPKCAKIKLAEIQSEQARTEFPLLVESKGHKLLTPYGKNNREKVLIDFNCEHGAGWISPDSYKRGRGCPTCGYLNSSAFRSMRNRKEFPLLVESKGHKLLTPYGKNSREKVLIDFQCEHEPHWITPDDYKHGYGCFLCGREKVSLASKKKSLKSRIELEKIIQDNGHVLLSEYQSNHEKVLIDFQCEHEPHWITPAHYKRHGTGCPKCGLIEGHKKVNEQKRKEFISIVESKGHTLLSQYKIDREKVLIDFKCEHEPHWVLPVLYKHHNTGCPKCSGHCSKEAEKRFLEAAKKIDYEVLGKYETSNKKVKMRCDKGHDFEAIPHNFVGLEQRCPRCQNRSPEQTKERFLEAIKEEGYSMIGTYNGNSKTKVKLLCDKGHKWSVQPTSFLNSGSRCIKCGRKSKGEKIVRKWLADNHIVYDAEYMIGNKIWRYDVYIPSINTIVEIHGRQHYQFEEHFHKTLKFFKQRQQRDKDKKDYAESLGYNYIEVDYREGKPELALERFLDQFGRISSAEVVQPKYEQLTLF